MKSPLRALLSAFLLLLPASTALAAGTVSVEYLVDRKLLLQGTTGNEKFVFDFHAENGCGSTAYTASLATSDPALYFERVRIQRIGGRRAGPDLVRLVARIEDVPSGAPFLRVTGPGIVAAGTDCQHQPGLVAPMLTSLPFADPDLMDRLLEISGAATIDRLREDLDKRVVSTDALCALTAEILAQSGAGIGAEVCANGIDPAGAAVLEGLLTSLFARLR